MKKNIFIFLVLGFLITCFSCTQQSLSDGYGNFDAHAVVIVSSQNTGYLLNFKVEEGDYLKAGQIIGIVDTTLLHLKKEVLIKQKETVASQLNNINASTAVRKQQLKINRVNQQRIRNLFKSNAATQKQLDDIDGLIELTKAKIQATLSEKNNVFSKMQSIDAQVAQVNQTIQQGIIKNPVGGTVLVKYAEKGELAIPGKPLYKIANLKTLELNAFVSGSQLNKVKIGQKVKVLYDKNKKANFEVNGIVLWISSQAEFTPKTIQTKQERVNLVYAVKIRVPNTDGSIKIGMPGEFRFINKNDKSK